MSVVGENDGLNRVPLSFSRFSRRCSAHNLLDAVLALYPGRPVREERNRRRERKKEGDKKRERSRRVNERHDGTFPPRRWSERRVVKASRKERPKPLSVICEILRSVPRVHELSSDGIELKQRKEIMGDLTKEKSRLRSASNDKRQHHVYRWGLIVRPTKSPT